MASPEVESKTGNDLTHCVNPTSRNGTGDASNIITPQRITSADLPPAGRRFESMGGSSATQGEAGEDISPEACSAIADLQVHPDPCPTLQPLSKINKGTKKLEAKLREQAQKLGLKPGSPRWRAYVLGTISASAKKRVFHSPVLRDGVTPATRCQIGTRTTTYLGCQDDVSEEGGGDV